MKRAVLFIMLLLAVANGEESVYDSWGIVSALRSASIPYATSQNDSLLDSYVLLLYLETPLLFLDGTEGGLRLYRDDAWEFAVYGAMHFVDMPRHDTHYFSDDTADLGLMARYRNGPFHTDLLLLSDPARRPHAALRAGIDCALGDWRLRPYARMDYKSAAYNSYYYGQERVDVGADVAAETGIGGRWYVSRNIALLAEAKLRYLGREVAAADIIGSPVQGELYLGAGIFGEHNLNRHRFTPKGYLRLALGEATPSSFSQIVIGEGERDPNRAHMLSLFYGLPLSKHLFEAGVQSYFSPGFVHHFADDRQPSAQEYVAAFKFYYRPPGWWLRFGAGTGLSYISRTTYLERRINAKDGYDHTSHLMQNLDFSFDVELSRLFGKGWENLWFGYALHHRSGVFESAHQYGQIKGGSNYNTLYLQLHFD